MNQNQFQFRRFWRLLRVKFAEISSILLSLTVTAILVIFAFRVGYMFFSSDNLPKAFARGNDIIGMVFLLMIGRIYFYNLGTMGGFVVNLFLHPATNLERYAVLHVLPIINSLIMMAIAFFICEGLWRLGLWLGFPDIYTQYIVWITENRFAKLILLLLFWPLAPYFMFIILRFVAKNMRQIIFVFGVVPILYILIIFGISAILRNSGIPSYFLLGAVLLVGISLIFASYRSFCNYEPNLEKTSTE